VSDSTPPSGVFPVTRKLELATELVLAIAAQPNRSCLNLLDSFPELSVKAILAAKHVFFTGDALDAQDLQCTEEDYRLGYELYRTESVAAKTPWAKESETK
jgi:hypothetical protein